MTTVPTPEEQGFIVHSVNRMHLPELSSECVTCLKERISSFERIGYLCIQSYPRRICVGCTSACNEPVFAYPRVFA